MPTETIVPFDRVTDVTVNMVISKPQPVKGLGNLLILNKVASPTLAPAAVAPSAGAGSTTGGSDSQSTTPADADATERNSKGLTGEDIRNGILLRMQDAKSHAVYKEFRDLDAVAHDYASGTPVYAKAKAYFAQDNASDRVAVLDYSATGTIDDALRVYWYQNWTFAILTDNTINDATKHLSNLFEANEDHFLVLQSNNIADFDGYTGQDYTIGIKHDTAEAMDAALVGQLACLPVGSITWKFKTLNGINPEPLTTDDLKSINQYHLIAYTTVFGTDQTTEGTTLSGEYIDNMHGDLWIKTEIQSGLQHLLQQTPKVTYDQNGISMLESVVTNVLQRAWEKKIVLTDEDTGKGDFSVSASPRSAQSIADLSARHYGGLKFTYHRSGAIHTVTVNGVVKSDTITSD